MKIGAIFGADNIAVAVPTDFDHRAGSLLERFDNRLRQFPHQLVLHANHVPVVDLHPLEIGLGLSKEQIRRQRCGHA
ncbi:hypothetical protein C2W62_25300 [Candidatus Entotheonella serta]|nr:hypothetical protein C2W62_25300 [Candidatus Entotheonella serta]